MKLEDFDHHLHLQCPSSVEGSNCSVVYAPCVSLPLEFQEFSPVLSDLQIYAESQPFLIL